MQEPTQPTPSLPALPSVAINQEGRAKMWEVEQKFHLTDQPQLMAALSANGFQLSHVEQHCDTYWQHPCRDFRTSDEAFRLRRINDAACMTYKGPRHKSEGAKPTAKTREEIELDIQPHQFEAWVRVLEQLGFHQQPSVIKQRTVFHCPLPEWSTTVVAVDQVEQLGTFVEVEQLVDDPTQLERAGEAIADLAHRLGLSHVQPHSYLSQLLTLHNR